MRTKSKSLRIRKSGARGPAKQYDHRMNFWMDSALRNRCDDLILRFKQAGFGALSYSFLLREGLKKELNFQGRNLEKAVTGQFHAKRRDGLLA